MQGKIISISGVDGAGKTTQLQLLFERLKKYRFRCAMRQFGIYSYGEIAARQLEELMENDFVFTRLCVDWGQHYPLIRDFVYNPDLQTREMAMAVNAVFTGGCLQVYASCLQPLLERGIHIVCDRYWLDDIVFRGRWIEEKLIRTLYQDVPRPDLPILLDVPADVLWERNQSRMDGRSPILKDFENIASLRNAFLDLAKRENMVVIDGHRSSQDIAEDITKCVIRAISKP